MGTRGVSPQRRTIPIPNTSDAPWETMSYLTRLVYPLTTIANMAHSSALESGLMAHRTPRPVYPLEDIKTATSDGVSVVEFWVKII